MPVPAAGLGVASDGSGEWFALGGRQCPTPYCGAPLDDFHVFDFISSTWTALPPMPQARGDISVAMRAPFSPCPSIIVVGGNAGSGPGADFGAIDEFDMCRGGWSRWPAPMDLPVPVSNAVAGVCTTTSGVELLYVIGGQQDGTPQNIRQVFDFTGATWSIASFASAATGMAVSSQSDGGGIYLAKSIGDPAANRMPC